MAAGEQSVIEILTQLYELQNIDSRIDEIEVLKGELPIEVSDLEDELAGLRTRISRLEENVKDLDTGISAHKTNIKDSEALIKKYEKQLDNVKNNREYEALTKEIELQKLEVQLSEKKINDENAKKEIKKAALDASNEKLQGREADLDSKKVALEKIIKKTEKQERKLKKESEGNRTNLEGRLLNAYDKIRTSYRNGLAVVTVKRDACGGCFNRIPPQLQIDITSRKKIITCEHCGRVLVDDETAGIEAAEE